VLERGETEEIATEDPVPAPLENPDQLAAGDGARQLRLVDDRLDVGIVEVRDDAGDPRPVRCSRSMVS
jgi:hypothetical protein